MRFFLFPLALLALSGCSTLMGADPFPTGYAYHSNNYHSQPGPAALPIGYPFSAERNDVVVEKWQAVATALVNRLEMQLNIQPQPVYIEMLPNQNTFNASLDYVLREELRNRGYILMASPARVLRLLPEAYLPGDEKISPFIGTFNDEKKTETTLVHPERAQHFEISLTARRDERTLGRVEDTFVLPAYGYVRGEGNPSWKDRYDTKSEVKDHKPQAQEAEPGAPLSLIPTPVQEEVIQEPLP